MPHGRLDRTRSRSGTHLLDSRGHTRRRSGAVYPYDRRTRLCGRRGRRRGRLSSRPTGLPRRIGHQQALRIRPRRPRERGCEFLGQRRHGRKQPDAGGLVRRREFAGGRRDAYARLQKRLRAVRHVRKRRRVGAGPRRHRDHAGHPRRELADDRPVALAGQSDADRGRAERRPPLHRFPHRAIASRHLD